jgi:hypothetical protein
MGVSETDISLLSNVVVASMKSTMGVDLPMTGTGGGMVAGGRVLPPEASGDQSQILEIERNFRSNPTLSLMLATFTKKAEIFRMPHPDVQIGDLPAENEEQSNGKKNGKNGKEKVH